MGADSHISGCYKNRFCDSLKRAWGTEPANFPQPRKAINKHGLKIVDFPGKKASKFSQKKAQHPSKYQHFPSKELSKFSIFSHHEY